MTGQVMDGLSAAIVNIARLMRHDGIRLVVSTQSPLALAPELLELVTVAVLHRFHSKVRDQCGVNVVSVPSQAVAIDTICYEFLWVEDKMECSFPLSDAMSAVPAEETNNTILFPIHIFCRVAYMNCAKSSFPASTLY